MRIVSLCPSITESLVALGLVESLAGVTRYCIHPRDALKGIPRVGGTKNPDLGAIRAAKPDLVFCNSEENRKEDIEALSDRSREVADTFTRIARAVRILNDERATLPDISDTEPLRLSFLVAAAMEIDAEVKQELLELRSTGERLRRLRDMLVRAVTSYEERARVHELAKGNGHSGRKVEME